jgi:hypothetical protein
MRMLKHGLKLLVLLTVAAVPPASAGQLRATDSSQDWCPYEERAKLAAEGYEVLPVQTVGEPAEGSFFDSGRRAVFAP